MAWDQPRRAAQVSALYFIRHGQASFHAADYDQLSALGHAQAQHLSQHLPQLDAVFTGPRVRQRDTARYLRGGQPEAVVLDELDEYPAEAIIRHALAGILAEDEGLRARHARRSAEGADPLKDARLFQEIFERSMYRWIAGHAGPDGAETFAAFRARVGRAIERVLACDVGPHGRIAVVTSAGPVAAVMGQVLGLEDALTLRLSWVVANTSITEVRRRPDELMLLSFNALPHLRDPALITYR